MSQKKNSIASQYTPLPSAKIEQEALAFQVWQIANPVDWEITLPEIAEQLDKPERVIRAVCKRKGWLSRVRPSREPTPIPALSQSISGHFSDLQEIALY